MRWLYVVLVAPAFLACSEANEPLEESQVIHSTVEAPIMGGYDDTEDSAVVGMVTLSAGLGICSGSLISPNVVLTAQHCVAPLINGQGGGVNCAITKFGQPYQTSGLFITTAAQMTVNPSIYTGVKDIIIPPGQGVCDRDVALLILSEPVPAEKAVPLAPRVDEPLHTPSPGAEPQGEEYSAIGFGSTSDAQGGSGKRRRRDNLNAWCTGSQCVFNPYKNEWVGDTGVCSGDSGGPAVDLYGRVLGVASRGGAGCLYPVYGYVYAWGDWLKENVLAAAEDAGIDPPAWATGWSTHPGANVSSGQECTNGQQCESMLCLGGRCSRVCDENAPCPDGYYCDAVEAGTALYDGSHCRPAAVGSACAADSECPGGYCKEGECTRLCDASLPCPAEHECSAELALCEPVEPEPPADLPCQATGDCDENGDPIGGVDGEAGGQGQVPCEGADCTQPDVSGEAAPDSGCQSSRGGSAPWAPLALLALLTLFWRAGRRHRSELRAP